MKKIEIDYINKMLACMNNEKIKDRYSNLFFWYFYAANKNKVIYYLLSILSIISGSIIPIINIINYNGELNFIISSISSLGAISLSICNLFLFKENWIRYRRIAELLKTESSKYINKINKYKLLPEAEADLLFLTNIENMTINENSNWLSSKELYNIDNKDINK